MFGDYGSMWINVTLDCVPYNNLFFSVVGACGLTTPLGFALQ